MKEFFKDPRTPDRLRSSFLGKFLDQFAADLADSGYSRASIRRKLEVVVRFGDWLQSSNIGIKQIQFAHIKEYFDQRWQRSHLGVPYTLKQFVNLLVEQQVVLQEPTCEEQGDIEIVIDEFASYLRKERGLYATTIRNYSEYGRKLLDATFGTQKLDFSSLSSTHIIDFVQQEAGRVGRKRAQLMTSGLRSFFQFLRYHGYIDIDLKAAVPTVPNWKRTEIPRALPSSQVELVLSRCERKTATGRRDYAILLLLARLGLRAGEVAALKLEDIDWESGLVTVHSKGRAAQLPLPPDVGRAIASYLKAGRSHVGSRSLFLRARAPLKGLEGQTAVGCIVKRALLRAGINTPRKGAHQFRHGLATRMLNKGATLAQIGELLRHQNTQTTEIYAKVDFKALRPLAMPWPGGAK